jgi:hypothetical protein
MEIFNNNISCKEIMSSITDVPFTVDKEYKIHHRENALSSLQTYSLWLMLNDIKFNNNHNIISINGKPVLENLKK